MKLSAQFLSAFYNIALGGVHPGDKIVRWDRWWGVAAKHLEHKQLWLAWAKKFGQQPARREVKQGDLQGPGLASIEQEISIY